MKADRKRMIEAIIFDMDGVLIDSEPSWKTAEIEIFASVGVQLTPELCEQTMGLRLDATVRYWYERSPWIGKTCSEVADEIILRVAELLQYAMPLPGVQQIIDIATSRNLRLALCSSSPYILIKQIIATLGLTDLLLIHSAEDEVHGKPHPAAYMTTANKCGIAYNRCLAFEDSVNGAIAAKAAGMRVVAVPQGKSYQSTRFDFCDAKIASLSEFDNTYFDYFGA